MHRLRAAAAAVSLFGLLAAACSIPNLASPECAEAKPALREFYSNHFGRDMAFTPESLKAKERFLTPRFRAELAARSGPGDPFTVASDDLPRAFRAGECTAATPGRVIYDVLLFWKDDNRSEQRIIKVEMEKSGTEWLIDRVVN